MSFTRKSADLTPLVDAVISVVAKAKADKQKIGADNVIDATIGSLYGEDEKLTAFDTVFDHYDAIDHRIKAAYASSYRGNPDFREDVWEWVTQCADVRLPHSVIATPGGTGAVSTAFTAFLDPGETMIGPNIAWSSYKLMASENNISLLNYEMFDGNSFNLNSVKEKVQEVMKKQDRIVLLVNDPCHNPTGYSMTMQEWKELIAFCNEVSRTHSVILIDDIAYIDFAYDNEQSHAYMNLWNDISDNVLVYVAFSCSKTLTSYGLRCGAGIMIAQQPEAVREVEIVVEKKARATWSSIPNAAMINFSWLVKEDRQAYLAEKEHYVTLMKQRSDLFLKEAAECGLDLYPYKEGFFVSLRFSDNETRSRVHEALMAEHIYTVAVNHGIRVGICSLPLNKISGLAAKIKAVEERF